MQRAACGSGELLDVQMGRGDVDERPDRAGHPKSRPLFDVGVLDDALVELYAGVARAEVRWNDQVYDGEVGIPEVVYGERGVVRNDREVARPQRPADQVVVGGGRPLGEPEDAAIDSEPVTTVGMELLRLVRVSDGSRLRRREVAGLTSCDGRQAKPQLLSIKRHTRMLLQRRVILNDTFSFA